MSYLPSSFDAWKTTPPEESRLLVCACGEEIAPGERCSECDSYAPTEQDLRDEYEDRRANEEWDRMREGY